MVFISNKYFFRCCFSKKRKREPAYFILFFLVVLWYDILCQPFNQFYFYECTVRYCSIALYYSCTPLTFCGTSTTQVDWLLSLTVLGICNFLSSNFMIALLVICMCDVKHECNFCIYNKIKTVYGVGMYVSSRVWRCDQDL